MDKILSLSKRRGFIFPGSEIYGGLANSWDYGPLGSELKKISKTNGGTALCASGLTLSALTPL